MWKGSTSGLTLPLVGDENALDHGGKHDVNAKIPLRANLNWHKKRVKPI